MALICADYDKSTVAYVEFATRIVDSPEIRDRGVPSNLACRLGPQNFKDLYLALLIGNMMQMRVWCCLGY